MRSHGDHDEVARRSQDRADVAVIRRMRQLVLWYPCESFTRSRRVETCAYVGCGVGCAIFGARNGELASNGVFPDCRFQTADPDFGLQGGE